MNAGHQRVAGKGWEAQCPDCSPNHHTTKPVWGGHCHRLQEATQCSVSRTAGLCIDAHWPHCPNTHLAALWPLPVTRITFPAACIIAHLMGPQLMGLHLCYKGWESEQEAGIFSFYHSG